jgi:hypothetical protein
VERAASERSWKRIADDLRSTTGRDLVVQVSPGQDHWWDVKTFVDGSQVTDGGRIFISTAEEEFAAELADYLREDVLDEEVWGGWPICPHHGTHPLEAMMDQGVATWCCPRDGAVARIGDLRAGSGHRAKRHQDFDMFPTQADHRRSPVACVDC